MGAQVSAPGPGNQADSMNMIIQAIQTLKQAGLGLQPGSKIHCDVFRTISQLSRHLGGAAGMGPASGIQQTMIGDQLKRTIQSQHLQKILGSKGQGGQPGQAGGGGEAALRCLLRPYRGVEPRATTATLNFERGSVT